LQDGVVAALVLSPARIIRMRPEKAVPALSKWRPRWWLSSRCSSARLRFPRRIPAGVPRPRSCELPARLPLCPHPPAAPRYGGQHIFNVVRARQRISACFITNSSFPWCTIMMSSPFRQAPLFHFLLAAEPEHLRLLRCVVHGRRIIGIEYGGVEFRLVLKRRALAPA